MSDQDDTVQDELLQELEQIRAESERLKDLAARAQADLQNAKARMEKEAGDMRKFALQGLITQLLPTVDNFQRAFAHLPEELASHTWVKGIQAVEQDFLRILSAAGLERMECMGEQADPDRHEVLQTGPGAENAILEVFEDGYLYQGKVLRPAKVRVGSGE